MVPSMVDPGSMGCAMVKANVSLSMDRNMMVNSVKVIFMVMVK